MGRAKEAFVPAGDRGGHAAAVLSATGTVRKGRGHLRRPAEAVRAFALLCLLAIAPVAIADTMPASPTCEAATPQEAKLRAAVLYEKGQFQQAGECYEAAGDQLRAQRSFLKAVGPNAEASARGLREERDTAKALLTQVQQAFRSNH
jgi:hypothetical protein